MYARHFGLASAPFRITPDTHRFYPGAQRGAVLEALVYAVEQGEGIVKLCGEIGSGKTMLCRMLAERLAPGVDLVYLANPSLRREDVLRAIAVELNLPAQDGRHELLQTLHAHLLARHAEGRRVVVLVEEAQGMDLEALEEIRLLSNLETREDKLLQIVLFGQPELDAHLAVDAVRQLRDRITHSFTLPPLRLADLRDYIPFRLRASGYQGGDPFSPMAYRLLAYASKGLIRRVHVLADKALLAAYAEGSRRVTLKHVRRAICDSEIGAPVVRLPQPAHLLVAAMLAVAGSLGYAVGEQAKTNFPTVAELARIQPAAGQPATGRPEVIARRDEAIDPDIGSPVAARITAARAWLEDDGAARFTIQVMTSDGPELEPLEQVLGDPNLAAHLDRIYLAPTRVGGRQCWSVLYGSFDDYARAQQALAALPAALQHRGPYLRSLTAVKKEASGQWLVARQDP